MSVLTKSAAERYIACMSALDPFETLQAVVDEHLANPDAAATLANLTRLMTALESALRAPLPSHLSDADPE